MSNLTPRVDRPDEAGAGGDGLINPVNTPAVKPLTDKQNEPDARGLRIDKVGVRGLRIPLQVRDKSRDLQNTVAKVGMFVDLPKEFKGTHMSRFVEVLNSHGSMVHVENIPDMLRAMQAKLHAQSAHLEMEFPFFLVKKAPVSGKEGVLDYNVRFDAAMHGQDLDFLLTVRATVTTLCPCSKAISKYGAHNQRSHITIQARTSDFVWIEEIVEQAESNASCELYGLLKRPDEKYVTERAYDNPKFVEDLVRDVAAAVRQTPGLASFVVEGENFESIHNHSAYARIES
jgi:GTP cyclohydrolase I